MLRTLERLRRLVAPGQLELVFSPRATPPLDGAAALLARLSALGLRRIERCTLTANHSTMVSYRGHSLRLHRAFTTAPPEVLQAVVGFVNGRADVRRRARRVLAAFEIPRPPGEAPRRRRPASHPADEQLVARLRAAHAALNRERFGGALGAVAIRVSRRMRSRLGHYSPGGVAAPEIAIARRHVRRDGWTSVVDTLVHEMVHQWQHETGRPIAHDREFRRRARTVGISPLSQRRAGGS